MRILKLITAVSLLILSCTVAADSREDLKRAENDMKDATMSVQQGISDALTLIRDITDESDPASRSNEVLEAIRVIENKALDALDQLALNGHFMNALNDVRVEIRQTLKTVEKMEPSPNRDRNLELLTRQFERFIELQQSITEKEGDITLLLSQFSGLKRDIQLSIRIGRIGELITSLESIESNLEKMNTTLGEVLSYEVGEVETVVTN